MMTDPSSIQTRIIKADEFEHVLGIASALKRSQHAISEAERQAGEVFSKAQENGFEKGFAAGLAKGLFHFSSAMDDTKNSLTNVEERINAVVLRAVEDMIGDIEHTELCRLLVKRALSDVATDLQPAKLHVASEEADDIRRNLSSLNIEIVQDTLLQKGEMVIECIGARRHIGIREQMDAFRRALKHG